VPDAGRNLVSEITDYIRSRAPAYAGRYAPLTTLVQRVGEKGAVWFEALVDPMDKPLSETMALVGLEIQDQHRFLHMIKTIR